MKKVVLFFALVLGLNANAQMVVKESVKDSVVWKNGTGSLPKLILFKTEETESLVFYYRNAEYTTLVDVEYFTLGDKQTAIDFFTLCIQAIDEKKTFTVDLNGESISMQKGVGSVFISTRKGYFYLTKKQLENILGSISN